LHGFGGSAAQAEQDYGVTDKGNAEHFIVVYPEGIGSDGPYHLRSWDAGNCCFVAQSNHVDDVHYISDLIDYLVANYKVDPKRVYVAGMSNGAMMAYTLACQLSDKIAAITSVSGTLIASSPCVVSRTVPIMEIHPSQDTKVPFNGGFGLDGVWFPAVDSGLNVLAGLDACGPFLAGRVKAACAGRYALDLSQCNGSVVGFFSALSIAMMALVWCITIFKVISIELNRLLCNFCRQQWWDAALYVAWRRAHVAARRGEAGGPNRGSSSMC
jgi:predicted esterase